MRRLLLPLPLVACLLAAGPAHAVPKEELAAQANAICKPTNQKLKALRQSGGAGGNVFARLVRIQSKQQRQLGKLMPDAPEQTVYAAFLTNGDKLVDVYKRFQAINRNPSQSAARKATRRSMRLNAKLERQADKLGATVCFAGPN